MLENILIITLTSAAISAGAIVGHLSITRAGGNEGQLMPTTSVHAFLCLMILSFVAMAVLGWSSPPRGEWSAFWGVILASGAAALMWYWYFHLRVVHWNSNGVGKRSFIGQRFIEWSALTYAGRSWDDSFVLRSEKTTIRYMECDGGHEMLNDAVKRHAPQFAKNF
jgi:hypothetical protein